MAGTLTKANGKSPDASRDRDKKSRVEPSQGEQANPEMVFTPFEGLLRSSASKGQPGRSDVEPARQGQGETDDDSLQLDAILGTSMIEPPLEWHAAILSDPRLAQPANGVQRARVVTRLQHNYGNAHVQRVIDRVEADTQGDPAQEAVSDDLEQTIAGERGSGQPIDSGTRVQMEAIFEQDFGDVNVHTDDKADDLARALQAKAFATGRDVFFRAGEYDPGTSAGQHLIAHELTHVVQQGGGRTTEPVQRDGQPHTVPAMTPETGAIQRHKKKPGKFIRKRLRQYKRKMREAKRTRTTATAVPPKKAPPPVPAKTYHLGPIMKGTYAQWYPLVRREIEQRKPFEKQIEEQKRVLRQKLKTGIMKDMTSKEKGGKTKGSATEYVKLVEKLNDYHKLLKTRVRDPELPDTLWDIQDRLRILEDVDFYVSRWQDQYGVWYKSRKKRRGAVAALKAQVEKERSRLKEVEAGHTELVDKRNLLLVVPEKPRRLKALAQEEGYYLEAYDPEHRDYQLLFAYWSKWPGAERKDEWEPGVGAPPAAFFEWVNQREKEALKAGDLKKPLRRIKYFTKHEREQRRLKFEGNRPQYHWSGKPFDQGIYVMAPDYEFYGQYESKATKLEYHHSSFLAGMPVGAAGAMQHEKGKLKVDLESGHYEPRTLHMANAVTGLKRKGVDLKAVDVRPFEKNLCARFMPADKFLAELLLLKQDKLKDDKGTSMSLARFLKKRGKKTRAQVLEAAKAVD